MVIKLFCDSTFLCVLCDLCGSRKAAPPNQRNDANRRAAAHESKIPNPKSKIPNPKSHAPALRFILGPQATAGAAIRAGVAVAILDDAGRVLLQRRTDGDWWGMPGGGLEAGDTFTSAAIREVREETGLEVEITRLLGAYTDPAICVVYPDGRHIQVAALCFVARIVGGEMITANEETAELRWFAADELPPNLLPTHVPRLAHLFSGDPTIHCD